ncbi:venom acid phosphatase Acph-1-like [Chrysoperla carnea]|uniref:venom acid phosphatase Acph-1-like n=1 Tax=Chrysoperla carnea TaxID=189513 RepID=UPI001D06B82F|nr:venom acid phosphatase Acph-1-like [Chrysoperla carnea]
MNLTIPEWMQKIYPEPLGSLASKYFQIAYSNTLMRRLNGGHIWRKILTDIEHKVHGLLEPKGRKIYLYSGHRKNAINLLATLDLWDTHLPRFCAATIVELAYKIQTNEYGIKIYYFDQKNDEPNLLIIPGCNNTFCEFHKFTELIKPIIPENYTMECGSKVNLDIYP